MKIRTLSGTTQIEVDGTDAKDCFIQLSQAQDVFTHDECGMCGGKTIKFIVRENAGNTFYEIKCQNCYAALAFGQRRADGSLYPRKKDKDGNWLDCNGWTKWSPQAAVAEPF